MSSTLRQSPLTQISTRMFIFNVMALQHTSKAFDAFWRPKSIMWGVGEINLNKAVKVQQELFRSNSYEF